MGELNLEIIKPLDDEGPATEKQKNFIRVVLRQVGGSAFSEDTLNDLGERQASCIIEQLKSFQRELHGTHSIDDARLAGLEAGKLDRAHVGIILAAVAILIVIWLILTFGIP